MPQPTPRSTSLKLRPFPGLLSPIGDGLGQVLDKGLKPVGHVVGQVGHPAGEVSNLQYNLYSEPNIVSTIAVGTQVDLYLSLK